jgi:hypothetical protein
MWRPKFGITNIFDPQLFIDPDGQLPLSLKISKNLQAWMRPIDVLTADQLINGMPDIGSDINGFEVQ